MVKETITPKESIYPLLIPSNYIGKTIELLLYSTEELVENKKPNGSKPSDFFGTLSLSEGEKFQEYVSNARSEWDRNI